MFHQVFRYPDFSQTVGNIPVAVTTLGHELGPAQAIAPVVEVSEFPDPLNGRPDDFIRRAF